MKIAFITHAIGVGGGSLSSSTTIQYLINQEFLKAQDCIVIHDKTKEPPNEKNDVYFTLRKHIKFYEVKLPFSLIFKGATSNYFIQLYHVYKEFISIISFFLFYNKILEREKITIVHLNSLVLWPLLLVLPKSMKRIIHIREVPIDSIEARIAILVIKRYANKIISIDPISDISFANSGKSTVILNPFNMTKSRQLRPLKKSIKSELGIPPENFVVSIFGRVEEQKGFDFFIKIIQSSIQIKGLVYAIIGKPSGKYGEKCIQLLNNYTNVKYLGEQTDTSKFYTITDVVIRCEDYLPLGRTVWEGIFSGGIALVPVNKNDNMSVIRDYIGKYIYTYQALNVDSCIETLNDIIKKYPDTVFDSGYPVADNSTISAEQFFKVITS